jgi:photosystem II stability/assembly factor-like uncharacterized protein
MGADDKGGKASGRRVLVGAALVTVGAVAAAVGMTRIGKGRPNDRSTSVTVGWKPAFPKPGHNGLQGVWGDGLHVAAVGRVGAILVSHDLGLSWRVRPSGVTEDLQSVWGDGRGTLVAVGNNGVILRSDDWGERWERSAFRFRAQESSNASDGGAEAGGAMPRHEAGAGSLTELWGDPASGELWASGRFGMVATSADRGRTWRTIETGSTTDLYAIWSDGRGTVVAAGREGTVLKSTDRGAHFAPRSTGSSSTLLSVREDGPSGLVAVGWFGTVLQSSDRGDHWTTVTVPTREDLTTVARHGASELVAVGMRGTALVRRNGSWTALTTNASETFGAFWSDGRVGVAVGTEGAIYRVHDGGARWEARTERVQGAVLAITGFGRARWAVGRGGMIVRSTDDGRTWSSSIHSARTDFLSAFALSEQELYLTNADNKILRSTDGGQNFTVSAPPQGIPGIGSVWASGPEDVYVAGPQGWIIKSTDRGATWRRLNTGVSEDFFALWGLGPNEVFAVATRGFIVRSTDRGVSWQRMINMSTRDLTNLTGDARGRLFAVGKEGEIVTSVDHGVHWRIARTNLPRTASIFGACVAGDVWYAAGLGSTLLRSADQGSTWTRENAYTNDDLTALWCDGRSEPVLGGYSGVLLTRGRIE